MKIKIFLLFFLSLSTIISVNAAAEVANNILVTWNTIVDTTWAWYGWKLVFPNDVWSWVTIFTGLYNINTWSWNMWISWNFWLQDVSSPSDPTLGYCTFDILTTWWATKVNLINQWDNTFIFDWNAWCNASGWVYFSPTWSEKVVYNRTIWIINWCAWSENLGWLCIDNFSLDTTPPDIISSQWVNFAKPFSANSSKSLTTPEDISSIYINNWDSTFLSLYNTNTFTHNFRKAKNYTFFVNDKTWNKSDDWNIKVVAWVPDWTVSSYNSSYLSNIIWDWKDTHNISFTLRDTYWNEVIPEAWIKDVSVQVWFNNNVHTNQILNTWNAISYSSSDFWFTWNNWIWTSSNGQYNINISSLAPTWSWYIYTTGNNISLSSLRVNVTNLGFNNWVWEWTNNVIFSWNYLNKNFSFSPAVGINWVSTNSSKFYRDQESIFTWSVFVSKTIWSDNITDLKIKQKLDIMNWTTPSNTSMSFQNTIWVNWTQKCTWNIKPNATNTSFYYFPTDPDCNANLNNSSNIVKTYSWPYTWIINFSDSFKSTPKIVTSALSNFDVKYSSEISYKIWGIDIKYNSLSNDKLTSIANKEVKITWIAHKSENSFAVVQDSSINYIWKISKTEIYSQIQKNIEPYKKAWAWTYWSIKYFDSTQTISAWPSNTDTIIVNWGDIIIDKDIFKENWKTKIIIAMKKDDWTKWNIWIKYWVSFIGATLITNRSIISWDWTTYYSDTWVADNQLFIKWSILSYNTIGWSSSANPKCPFYVSLCNETTSKRYDLNNFRNFINWEWDSVDWTTYWVNMSKTWYADAPIIVEYDSEIQTTKPKILLVK